MDLSWSEADSAFRDEVRAFLEEKLTPEIRRAGKSATSVYPDHEASMEWQRILHGRGWAAPAWPVEYGGCDWSLTQHYIFSRESILAGAPSLSPMGIRMVAHAIIAFGTQEQKDYFLPGILTGEVFFCQGYSEPEAGSDLASLSMAAVEDGDDLIVTGSKIWTTHATEANWMFALVRTDPRGRNYQTLLHEDLFAPLKMDSTSMGLRPDLAPRHVRPDMRGTVPIQHLSRNLPGDHALFEDPEVEAPHVGCASTSGDLYRFAEMLRRGGELDGVRLLSPAMLELARQVHTGDMPNQLYKRVAENAGWIVPPANQGIGFQVRGPMGGTRGVFHHLFGTLASPETHGNYGAGSTMFWVDPARDVSFALCSAGVMTQASNIERCQKLSDLALSAMV